MTATESDHRAEWLEWRKQGIGASDIASATTGLYGGQVGVVADKLGIGTDDIDPEDAERGNAWEHRIADVVLHTHGYHVLGEQALVEHHEDPRWRCTLDGLLHPDPEATIDDIDALLEIKTSRLGVAPKWEYYALQTQWQMHVTGMRRALIACAVINAHEIDPDRQLVDLRFKWVDREDHTIEQLVTLAEELWQAIEAERLPTPTDGTTLGLIRAANATADPDATADIDDLAEQLAAYVDLKARFKKASDDLKLAESLIRDRMGQATEATTTDGRWRVRCGEPVRKFTRLSEEAALLAYPAYAKNVLDRDRFKAELPDEFEEFKYPTPDRRLTIKDNQK